MNSMIGKSTGIALLMAAAMLAALFAMGVFSVTGVGAHQPGENHPITDTPDTHAHALITGLTIGGAETPMKADGTEYVNADLATIYSATVEVNRDDVELIVTPSGNAAGTEVVISWNNEEVTLDPTGDPSVTAATIDLTDEIVKEVQIVVSDSNSQDNGTAATNFLRTTYTIGLNHDDSPTTSDEAGAVVGVTLKVDGTTASDNDALQVDVNDEVTIDFGDDFGVPSSIDPEDVTINGMSASDVWVDDGLVTVSWDDLTTEEAVGDLAAATDVHTIRIRRAAGITNPTTAGLYGIKVGDDPEGAGSNDGDPKVEAQNIATVVRSIGVKPKSAERGAEIVITGKGFSGGSATVFIDMPGHTDDSPDQDKSDITTDNPNTFTLNSDGRLVADDGDVDSEGEETDTPTLYGESYNSNQDVYLGVAPISDGSFELTTTVDARFAKDALGLIRINANDGSGLQATAPTYSENDDATASNDGTFSISSSISANVEKIALAKSLEVKIKDWPASGSRVTEVTIGGGSNALDSDVAIVDGAATIEVVVPADTNIGVQKVVVKDNADNSKSFNVEVQALALSVSPSSAVNRQQITVQGSGFGDRKDIASIEIGSSSLTVPSDAQSSSAGNVVLTLNIPEDVDPGTRTITVVDDSGRTGTVDLTIPKPAISLDPGTSRRGSTVTVTGTGFPANDLILVSYPQGNIDRTVGTGQTDSTGNFTATFSVPSFANIGGSATVKAASSVNTSTRSATDEHSLPAAVLSVNPDQVASGSSITISGENMAVFASIGDLMIGGVEVTPSPAPSTTAEGSFSASVLVPQLELGNQQVSVVVGGRTSTTFVEIVTATVVVSTDPAEVFAPLVEAGRLARVWYQDRATQAWTFYDPDPAFASFNRLNEVSSGQVVTIIITDGEPIPFQGETLYQGSNSIALD